MLMTLQVSNIITDITAQRLFIEFISVGESIYLSSLPLIQVTDTVSADFFSFTRQW